MARDLCSENTRVYVRTMRPALPVSATRGSAETAALYLLACLFWAVILVLAWQTV